MGWFKQSDEDKKFGELIDKELESYKKEKDNFERKNRLI